MKRAWPLLLSLALGCSFTTATGFEECNADVECAANQACLEGYCIALPAFCRRDEGDFQSGDHLPLGAVLPLSTNDGGVDDSDVANLNAYRLAVKEANEKQGLNGRKLALYVCDSAGDDARARTQSAWLAKELGVPAVFASGSSQATAAAVGTADAGAPLIMSPNATSPDLIGVFQSQGQRVWRVAPPDTLQARVVADLFSTPDGGFDQVTKVAVLYERKAYGEGLSGALRDRLMPRLSVVTIPFERDGDVNAPVASVDAQAPQVTIVIGFPPDIRRIIARARSSVHLTAAQGHRWFFSDSAKDPAMLVGTLGDLTGSLGTAPAQNAGPTFSGFAPNYETTFGYSPATYSFTSHSYDAMYLVLFAAAHADAHGGLSGPNLVQGLRALSVKGATQVKLLPENYNQATAALRATAPTLDVVGASGELDFDLDAGAPPSRYELWQVLPDAGFSTVKLLAPSGT